MENSEAIKSTAPGSSSPYANPKESKQNFVSSAAPTYAAAFRCIGASCEDTCCGDWDIPVDRETYGKYQGFPVKKLGALVSRFVLINAPNPPDSIYAQIYRDPSGLCPFLGTDHLCYIQKEYGPELLPVTCSIYPRSLSRVAGELEGSLSLSCPEAVRNVLLVPDFMQIKGDLFSGTFRTDNIFRLASDQSGFVHKEEGLFTSIRTLLIDMVRDRSRPMWNRLLLIGPLCKLMDDVKPTEEIILPTILGDYRQIIENQIFPAELDSMPSLPRVKMEMIFELTDARIRDGAGPRFQDTFWTFVQGICAPPSSLPGDDIHRFLQAEEMYHRPFFAKFPFILENYLGSLGTTKKLSPRNMW
jgi:lysine-N-methylase